MKVGELYLAHIFINTFKDNDKFYGSYVKKALVYPYSILTRRYCDLFTGEIYYSSIHDAGEGEMYINFKYDLIPLCNYQCLDMKFHENLPEETIKSRVLKKYDQIIGDEIDECE